MLIVALASLLCAMLVGLVAPAIAGTASPFDTMDGAPDADSLHTVDLACESGDDDKPRNGAPYKLNAIHTAEPPPAVIIENSLGAPKSDICDVWMDTKSDGDGDVWLYFGWERASNTGSQLVYLEMSEGAACDLADWTLNCNPFSTRGAGTVVLVFDFQGTETGVDVRYREWEGSAFGAEQDAGGSIDGQASENGFFGEASVNLTTIGLLPNANTANECKLFASAIPYSMTGNSDTDDPEDNKKDASELVDIVAADIPPITNCGVIEILKDIRPDSVEGDFEDESFDFDLLGPGGIDVSSSLIGDSVTGAGQGYTFGDAEDEKAFAGDGYTLSEDPPSGWTPGEITCTVPGLEDGQPVDIPVGDGSGFDVVAGEVTTCVIVNTADLPDLTVKKEVVNNHGGQADATEFGVQIDGVEQELELDDPESHSPASVTQTDISVGEHTIGEIGLDGYTMDSIGCVVTDTDTVVEDQDDDADTYTVDLDLGDDVTCTIVNDDDPADLTVIKRVVNDNGGDAAAEDFDVSVANSSEADMGLDLTDEEPAEGFDSQASDTLEDISADTYTISEADVSGYSLSSIQCATADAENRPAVPNNGGGYDVALANGDDVTCVLVNDDDAPGLTIIKQVVNDHNGTAEADEFEVYYKRNDAGKTSVGLTDVEPADGTIDSQAASEEFDQSGTYTIGEEPFDDYSLTSISCYDNISETSVGQVGDSEITVQVGQEDSVTCTLVNTDDPAKLTVVKNVRNDDGGNTLATGFGVSVSGPSDPALMLEDVVTEEGFDDTARDVLLDLAAGTYTINEVGAVGYVWEDFDCVDNTIVEGDDSFSFASNEEGGYDVELDIGDDVTCTLINDDQPAQLTLYKDVINDNGRTATADDFTPSVNPDPLIEQSFVFNAIGEGDPISYGVPADEYIVGEDTPPSTYTLTGVACYSSDDVDDGEPRPETQPIATGANSAMVDIGLGDDVTCIVTNDDVPPPGSDEDPYRLIMGPDAVNPINTTHTFTATLTVDRGSGYVPAPGRTVRFEISGVGTVTSIVTGTVDADGLGGVCTTDTDGECDIVIASGESGTTTVTATADRPADATSTSDLSDDAVKTWVASPAIDLVKTVDDTTPAIGQLVTYTYTITNTGDVTLSNVQLEDEVTVTGALDEILDLIGIDAGITLDPGESTELTSTRLITEDDFPGPVDNVATVTGEAPDGTEVSDSDDASVAPFAEPAISLDKEPDAEIVGVDPDDPSATVIEYSFTVTNEGNVTLTDIALDDFVLSAMPPDDTPLSFDAAQELVDGELLSVTLDDTTLAPGESTFGTLLFAVRGVDVDLGLVTNVAQVTGVAPDGATVSDEDVANVSFVFPDVVVPPPAPVLPATGADIDQLTLWALLTAGLGMALVLLERGLRPHPRRRRR